MTSCRQVDEGRPCVCEGQALIGRNRAYDLNIQPYKLPFSTVNHDGLRLLPCSTMISPCLDGEYGTGEVQSRCIVLIRVPPVVDAVDTCTVQYCSGGPEISAAAFVVIRRLRPQPQILCESSVDKHSDL